MKARGAEVLTMPRRRPDFVILPEASIGVYSRDSFDQDGESNGLAKVLILELKRGGFTLSYDEQRQGLDYARELMRVGKVQNATQIVVYVLGAEVPLDIANSLRQGEIEVHTRAYGTVLRQAHNRTFNLLEKIRRARQDDIPTDLDIEEALRRPRQSSIFGVEKLDGSSGLAS